VYYSNQPLSTPLKFWKQEPVDGAEFFARYAHADDELRRTARSIVDPTADPERQVERLMDWCRREIRVSASDAPDSLRARHIDANKDARAVLRQRAGTAFELDLLFGALARAAGFDVRYVRVPSRKKIYFDQEMMDLRFLPSYDIAVKLGGQWRCFDAQARRLPRDMLPWGEGGQMALFCDRDSSMFIETQVPGPPFSTRSRSRAPTPGEEGRLEGDVQVELSGHWNAALRDALVETSDSLAAVREQLGWKGDWLELSALRLEPSPRESDPLRFRVHARIPSHAVRSGKRML